MTLKVGDRVVRNDGYSRGLVVAVLEDTRDLNPHHQVVIRQRHSQKKDLKDTVVTRDTDGFTSGGYSAYQFVREKKEVTVDRFYIHWQKSSEGDHINTSAFQTEEQRKYWLTALGWYVNVLALTQESFTYEVDDDV